MVYHRFLFGSVLWIVFIMLLALPRGLQAVLVIVGTLPVLLVALAMTKSHRLSKRTSESLHASNPKEQRIEQMLDKAADQIVETFLDHPDLVHDAEIETRDVVHQLYEALGESSVRTAVPNKQITSTQDTPAPKHRRPRKVAATLSESFTQTENKEI
jgi:hypothetical protein